MGPAGPERTERRTDRILRLAREVVGHNRTIRPGRTPGASGGRRASDRYPGRGGPFRPFAGGTLPARSERAPDPGNRRRVLPRSEEHTSELQSLMRISYAVFCLKKKQQKHEYTYERELRREHIEQHKK